VLRLPAWVSRYAAARGSRHERERERALYSPHGRSGKMVAFVDERFIATRTQHLINCNVRRERKKEKRAACVERARKSESERARERDPVDPRLTPPSRPQLPLGVLPPLSPSGVPRGPPPSAALTAKVPRYALGSRPTLTRSVPMPASAGASAESSKGEGSQGGEKEATGREVPEVEEAHAFDGFCLRIFHVFSCENARNAEPFSSVN